MKWLNKILLMGFAVVLLSSCTAMYVQTSYDDNDIEDQQIVVEQPIIIIIDEPEIYVPQPVIIVQPVQEAPKTKLRTEGQNNNSNKIERKTGSNENYVRNNTGQRNTKSRGK